jgi:1-aminocyclopropane-1-carboxylate deaminase
MYKNIATQSIRKPLHKSSRISVDVLRLDLIHPDISGNKWFKLKYHIEAARRMGKKGIVTFGGAYSNHLVATAVACNEHGLLSAGIVRGEQTFPLNASVRQMMEAGMMIIYASREQYKNKDELLHEFLTSHNDYHYVAEGGQSAEGIKGAGEILSFAPKYYSHIICPVGTGTTLAGLINASSDEQEIIGVCPLKIEDIHNNEIETFIRSNTVKANFRIVYDYHFGGYAKKTSELLAFMNDLFINEQIPTDFVYTGKMFYAVFDMIDKGYFPEHSRLLLIHTGGLQGNRSLPAGTLVF